MIVSLPVRYIDVYKYIFSFALIMAQQMFIHRLPRRRHYWLRTMAGYGVYLALVTFFPFGSSSIKNSSLMFSTFFLASIAALRFCYDVNWQSCIFCGVAGYTIQHIASILENMISVIAGFHFNLQFYSDSAAEFAPFTLLTFIEVYALIYDLAYCFFARWIRPGENITIKSNRLLALMVMMLLVEVVLNSVVINQYAGNMVVSYYISASLTNLVCSLAVLVLLFELLLHKSLEDEVEILNHLLYEERKQYEISSETIDIINVKCHDLRHQIRDLRKGAIIDAQALREVERNISIYESFVTTGNRAMDTILAERGLYCQRHGISLNCMIDGDRLGFMSDMDIYSLFGNMLENAIHSVLELGEDQRIISLSVKAKGRLLSIHSNNRYEGQLEMKNDLPQSKKAAGGYHGFGVKSMTMIVAKYGGSISFKAEDGVFHVNILFPMAASQPDGKGS